MSDQYVLPDGVLPVQYAELDLDRPFWEGTREEQIRIQRCRDCGGRQWSPELICHHCHSFDLAFEAVAPAGTIYSWERVWHPSHPDLAPACPYVVVLVELDDAPGIRLLGNLVGDQLAAVRIGAPVRARFEHHAGYSLVQWERVD